MNASPKDPVRIADRVWWVGVHRDGAGFQCHSYLIEHGDQSVLIDPGAPLGFPETKAKIERIIPFDHVRYFICHHQDPDITSALPQVSEAVTRPDAQILAHWRAIVLLDGYDLKLPMVCVERDLNWCLDLGGRELKFVFTPYAHFPGAFCTFDSETQVLFSSDLFGGFTEGPNLYAEDEGYFENIRPFHEHYIPSREVLVHAVLNMQAHPVRMIAPQHGCVIPERLVDFFMEKIKTLECGLFLLSNVNSDVERLSLLNRILRDVTKSMIVYRDFRDIVGALLIAMRDLIPAAQLEFFARADGGRVLHLAEANRFHGVVADPPDFVVRALAGGCGEPLSKLLWSDDESMRPAILMPLGGDDGELAKGVAIIQLDREIDLDDHLGILVSRIRQPLQVALEREAIYRLLEIQRQQFYEQSIRDPLTGLFTRLYMNEAVRRFADIHDHDVNAPVALAMIDIDHFKDINDTFGHAKGDTVLRLVSRAIMAAVRSADIPVRFGGEEFALFTAGSSARAILTIAERIRAAVADIHPEGIMANRRITVSIGVATRHQGEDMGDLIERADAALYAAKRGGRNRVEVAGG
ncbi:MAG: diguanylate cyclase [Rhodospirillaceae bacterium]|nr:diguanylate cyclase [Rhodospirillales bacterium]